MIRDSSHKSFIGVRNSANLSSKVLSSIQNTQNIPFNDNIINNIRKSQFKSVTPLKKRPNNNIIDTNNTTVIEENSKNKNSMNNQSKRTNITVTVRSRPLSKKELDFNNFAITRVLDNKIVVLLDPYEYNGHNEIFKNRNKEQHYAFDYAFDENASQEDVFKQTVLPLIENVLEGYNCTVFAYGSTGAGKTHTMLGNEQSPGIMPQSLQYLFNQIDNLSSEKTISIKLWYLEIYNENLRDLLKPNNEENIEIREDPQKGTLVSGISEVTVKKSQDIINLLKKGNKNRSTESTNANEVSSRSHAVLQLIVEIKEKNAGVQFEVKQSRFSMIDLAGSERASATQNKGIRLIEGANINRSLLTLGNCITALSECADKGLKPHIPYRDSKLTRILKDSLGGNSKTVMIANISPSAVSFEDTYNTLKYANRAKNIKTNISKNTYNVQHHIANYENIIQSLRNEIIELKSKINNNDINPNNNNTDSVNSMNNISNIVNNSINNNFYCSNVFEKCVKELKSHLDKELQIKGLILQAQQDLEELNTTTVNSSVASLRSCDLMTNNNSTLNSRVVLKEEINSIENKENINKNDEAYFNSNLKENNNFVEKATIDTNNPDLIQEQILLEKELNDLETKLSQLVKKREEVIKNSYNKQLKDFYKEHISSIIIAHDSKLSLMEKDKDERRAHHCLNKKNSYIKQLENQVNLRDKIIKEKNLIEEITSNHEIKSIKELKRLYKLPKLERTPIVHSMKIPSHIDNLMNNNNSNYNNYMTTNNLQTVESSSNNKNLGINNQHHNYNSNNINSKYNNKRLNNVDNISILNSNITNNNNYNSNPYHTNSANKYGNSNSNNKYPNNYAYNNNLPPVTKNKLNINNNAYQMKYLNNKNQNNSNNKNNYYQEKQKSPLKKKRDNSTFLNRQLRVFNNNNNNINNNTNQNITNSNMTNNNYNSNLLTPNNPVRKNIKSNSNKQVIQNSEKRTIENNSNNHQNSMFPLIKENITNAIDSRNDITVDNNITNLNDVSNYSNNIYFNKYNNLNFYNPNNNNNNGVNTTNLNITQNNNNAFEDSNNDDTTLLFNNINKPQLKKKDLITHLHKRKNSPK